MLCVQIVWCQNGRASEYITLTDPAGRSVRVPKNPQRVVSLAPSITEIVFSVNRGDRLVGVTEFSDYPEAAGRIASVGTYVYLDLEKIVSLNPDLCIAIKDGNPGAIVSRIEAIGIPVFAVNPRDLNSVIQAIHAIGNVLNADSAARARIEDMNSRLQRIGNLVSKTTIRPSVFFQIGVSPIVSAGADTFINELIERAGGRNVAAAMTGYPRFSKEEVLARMPEIMIVTSMARQKTFDQAVEQWRQWPDLPAVKHDRIYLVDSDVFDRPSPRLVDGLERLVRLIHPELFQKAP